MIYGNSLSYSILIAIVLGTISCATTDSSWMKYWILKDYVIENANACEGSTKQSTERKEVVRTEPKNTTQKRTDVQVQRNAVGVSLCNVKCKVEKLIDAGIKQELAVLIVNTCKESAIDPIHCIKVGASTAWAESTGGKVGKNPFWFRNKTYKNEQEAVSAWISKYNRYWYTATGASFFYPISSSSPAPSRFCTDESGSGNACPRGNKNFTTMWNKLDFLNK